MAVSSGRVAADYRQGLFKFISTDPGVGGKHRAEPEPTYIGRSFLGQEEAFGNAPVGAAMPDT